MNNIKLKSDCIILSSDNINSLKDNSSYIINDNLLESDLIINIPDNYNLKFYIVNSKAANCSITFNQCNNSKLEFYFSFICSSKTNYLINNNVDGSNNYTVIKGRIFNDVDANTIAEVNGNIKEGTINNDYTEDVRGLNIYSNSLLIKPNLLVSTSDVTANHMVTIGNFNEDMVNYLKQKGISDDSVKKLLLNSFLQEIFPREFFIDIDN